MDHHLQKFLMSPRTIFSVVSVKPVHTFLGICDTIMVLFLPLYHIYAFMHTLTSLYTRSCDVIMPKYDLWTFIHTVKKYKVWCDTGR